MAEKCFPTAQRMQDFNADGKTFGDFVNGKTTDGPNINRVGADVENLEKIKKQALEAAAGAARLQTYLTVAQMRADTSQQVPTTGQVTNDPDANSNGYYVWDGSEWVWSGLQPALVSTDQNPIPNRADPGSLANALFFAGDINGRTSLAPDGTHGFYYTLTTLGARPRSLWLAEGGELSLKEPFDLVGKMFALDVTVGKRGGSEFPESVDFEIGIQFLDSSNNIISNEPIEILTQFSASTASFSHRFGAPSGLAGLDVTPPRTAQFGRPYIKMLAGRGLIVRSLYVNQVTPQFLQLSERIDEMTEHSANGGVIGFLDTHSDSGGVWDFSASGSLRNLSQTGVTIPATNNPLVRGAWGGYRAYKAKPVLNFGRPLLPANESTLVMSFVLDTTLVTPLFSQTSPGVAGSIQIYANARFTGTSWTSGPGSFGAFIRGSLGGKGVNGNPLQWQLNKDSPNTLAIIVNGDSSYLKLNGQKIDTFSVPSEIYQGNATLGGGSSGASALMGRVVCVPRALSDVEVAQVESWCADAFGVQLKPPCQPDESSVAITAKTAAAVLVEGGRVKQTLFAHNAVDTLIPASMTKVCCALVAARNATPEMLDGSFVVEVLGSDATAGTGNNLKTGDTVRFVDLFYNLMLPSSNLSATIISRVIGKIILNREKGVGEYSDDECKDRFIEQMNIDARNLGAHMTRFATPSGLGSENRSTALDMLKIASEFVYSEFLRGVWSTMEYTFSVSGDEARTISIVNTANEAASLEPDLVGGKTGTLRGGWNNFVGEYLGPNGSMVLILAGGSKDANSRFKDCRAIKTFIQESFDWPVLKLSAIPR